MREIKPLYILSLTCLVAWAVPLTAAQKNPLKTDLPPAIVSFLTTKEQHARDLTKQLNCKVSDEVWKFFSAAKSLDWEVAETAFEKIAARPGVVLGSTNDPAVCPPVWQVMTEVEMIIEAFSPTNGAAKFVAAAGDFIVASIPPGSIYFGGTEAGRGLPTAFSKSHASGEPFFTLTQNAMSYEGYLGYARAMYGRKIRLPSEVDSQASLNSYLTDAERRLESKTLRPGEDVRKVNGKIEYRGQVAVMAINGLQVKWVFDKNPEPEFYVEESFPLDWMYPHLAPHGFIFKLNREPLPTLTREVVAKDHAFWAKQHTALLGDWLADETTVQEVCAFVERIFLKKDMAGFKGDAAFVQSDYARKMYSKLRASHGGLYFWRAGQTIAPDEQQRMNGEADFAFRQAFAMSPASPEAVFRYVNLLVQANRLEDSFLIARTAAQVNPAQRNFANLIADLERLKQMRLR